MGEEMALDARVHCVHGGLRTSTSEVADVWWLPMARGYRAKIVEVVSKGSSDVCRCAESTASGYVKVVHGKAKVNNRGSAVRFSGGWDIQRRTSSKRGPMEGKMVKDLLSKKSKKGSKRW